jgi:hypothetical protein
MVRKRCLCRMMIPCESARLRFLMFFFMIQWWTYGNQVGFDAQKGRYSVLVQGGHGLGSAPTSVLEVSLQGRNCILKTGNLGCAGLKTESWNFPKMGEIWWTYCQVCFWYKQFLCTGTILKRQTQTVRLDFQLFLAEFAQCLCADATLRWILTTQKEWGQIAWDE